MKTKIIEIKDSTCPICKLKCKTYAGLSKHLNSKHKED